MDRVRFRGVRVGTERWWETSEGRLESPNPFVSEKDARRTARTWEENHRYVRPKGPASPAGVRPPRRRVRVPRGGLLSTSRPNTLVPLRERVRAPRAAVEDEHRHDERRERRAEEVRESFGVRQVGRRPEYE